MPTIIYHKAAYQCRDGETVLDALLRGGANMAFSCRGGACHVCLMRSQNKIPEAAQAGLSRSMAEKGYFLPCICQPQEDMEILPPRDADLLSRATVYQKELLNHNVCRLLLETATPLYYHPGQYINVWREDGTARSYSLASVPRTDPFLELHIKRVPDGIVSNWVFDQLEKHDHLNIQGPLGQCYYHPGFSEHPLLLLGTGTGVSPLLGITRDALNSGHKPDIYLYHGSRHPSGLYLHRDLLALTRQYPNFHYFPCLDGDTPVEGYFQGSVQQVALQQLPNLSDWKVFLCGNPAMVEQAGELVKKAGTAADAVFTDAFTIAEHRNEPGRSQPETNGTTSLTTAPKRSFPPPDPEMWKALQDGKRLRMILDDFYTRVFNDPRLAPFFSDTTKEHTIGKQYSFLYKVFTGEDVYFGDDMANAHHWMVISNELFDYREMLFQQALRDHDFPEHLIERFRALHESYRSLIVKSKPQNRVLDGIVLPLDGYGELTLDFGAICDSCQAVIDPHEKVLYHLRLGLIYCNQCAQLNKSSPA